MFCPNCGTQIEDNANFCVKCGSKISRDESTAELITASAGFDAAPKDDARGVVKNIAKGGLFLAAAILLTAGILINLSINISTLFTVDSLIASYYELFEGFGYTDPQMMGSLSSGVTIGATVGVVIGSIPNIIMIIGIWIIFGSAAKKESLCPSTTGVTLCKGVTIAYMVWVIVSFSLIILGSLMMLIAGAAMMFNAVEIDAAIVLMIIGGMYCVIFPLILVFSIIYYTKILKTIKAVTVTIKNGTPTAYVSRFVIFMCFFTGVLNGIISLVSLNIGVAAVAAAYIIFGIILIKYKKQMTYLRGNGNIAPEASNIQ